MLGYAPVAALPLAALDFAAATVLSVTGPLLFGAGGLYVPGGSSGAVYVAGGTSGGVYVFGGDDGGVVA